MSYAPDFGYPGWTRDEVAGISLLYPAARFLDSVGAVRGRITRADGTPVPFVVVSSVTSRASGNSFGPRTFTDAHGQFVLEGLPPERTMLWIHPYFVPTAHFFSAIEPGADDIHHALVRPVVEAGRIVDVGEITVTSHPGGPQVTFPGRSRVELAVGLLLGLGCQSEQSAVSRPTTLPAPAPPAPTPPEEPATNYLVPGFTGLYFTPGEPLLLTEGSTVFVGVNWLDSYGSPNMRLRILSDAPPDELSVTPSVEISPRLRNPDAVLLTAVADESRGGGPGDLQPGDPRAPSTGTRLGL